MMTGPLRKLPDAQQRVADLISYGLNADVVAARLGIEVSTVRSHVQAIANILPNPDNIPPYRLVMLWAAHQRWLRERDVPKIA